MSFELVMGRMMSLVVWSSVHVFPPVLMGRMMSLAVWSSVHVFPPVLMCDVICHTCVCVCVCRVQNASQETGG